MVTARNVLEANSSRMVLIPRGERIWRRASGSLCEVVFADFSQACPAILAVKYAEKFPHDRTPLFDRGLDIRRWFQGVCADPQIWFRPHRSIVSCEVGAGEENWCCWAEPAASDQIDSSQGVQPMTQKNRTPRRSSVIDADTGSGAGQVSARPHDSGSQANETGDGLDATTEALRHAAEDTPTGTGPGDVEKTPVFDRAGAAPKI
jgi:hypothetical protein